jgi:magnesium-protoporphyrin O-methyltransferase
MRSSTYLARRGELEAYFDRTAAEAWRRLTSDAPVSGIRATVRAGRERMRGLLLDWLPADLSGRTLLDAGCGTGALALEAAARGATVTAVDLSPTLIGHARERSAGLPQAARVRFAVGDMLDPAFGTHDHVAAMDSLIHYDESDVIATLAKLAERTRHSMVVTFAPRTVPLMLMHAAGRLFPRSDRAPAIEPVAEQRLLRRIAAEPRLADWRVGRTRRIVSGFYTSQALELLRR